MNGRRILLAALSAAALVSGMGGGAAEARAIPHLHIKRHLRVDGSSDLRGNVRARSGLRVTAGLTTDTLSSTGPVEIGGILKVAGVATTAGLNAGAGTITTTGTLQGGTLTTSGDANVGGGLAIAKALSASGASLGAAGLQVAGSISGTAATFSGAVGVGSLSTTGSVTAGNATFSKLSVAPGGTVNFNNASISGASGMTLTGNANVSSLQITSSTAGGASGAQALTISQAGNTASLSVGAANVLTVKGEGLAAPSLAVANNASIGGTLSVGRIASTTGLTLDAPAVSTTRDLVVGVAGNLRLDTSSSGSAHLLGNHDTRGQCSVSVSSAGGVKTCGVSFSRTYASAPVVVVTPVGTDPTIVSGYSLASSPTGFTISFTTTRTGTVAFEYMVEG